MITIEQLKEDTLDMVKNVTAIHGEEAGDYMRIHIHQMMIGRLFAFALSTNPLGEKIREGLIKTMMEMNAHIAALSKLSNEQLDDIDKVLIEIAKKYMDWEKNGK